MVVNFQHVFMMSTPRKLNKSYSESELCNLNLENLCIQEYGSPTIFERNASPFVKKTILIVEEVYHNSPLMSRYGQSVPNKLHSIEKTYSNILASSSSTNSSHIKLNSEMYQKNQELNEDDCDEIVPMDIDSVCSKDEECVDVIEKMDVDTHYDEYRVQRLNSLDGILKKRKYQTGETVLSENESLKKNNTLITPIFCEKNELKCSSIILILIVSIILLSFGLWYFHGDIYVNHDIQLQNLQTDLLEQIYDQKGPINIIIRSLEHRSRWANKIKVVGFIGSSGVGKTFVANILKKHFHSTLVHELYGIQLDFKNQWEGILNRLKSCCLNLIIIDDLNKKDAATLFELVRSLPRNQYILVISIFSIQYSDDQLNYIINYDDISGIRYEFDNSNLFHELAVFNQFSMYQVKDWLEKQLKVQSLSYSEKLLSNILHNHNATHEGLKGLYSKMLLELERKD